MHASHAQLRVNGRAWPAQPANPRRALFVRTSSESHLKPRMAIGRAVALEGDSGWLPNLNFAPARRTEPDSVVEPGTMDDWRKSVSRDPELAAFYGDRIERIAPKPGRSKVAGKGRVRGYAEIMLEQGNGRGTVRTEAEVYAMLAEAVGGRSTVEHRSEW